MMEEFIRGLYGDYFEGTILSHRVFERNIEEYEDYRIRIVVEDDQSRGLIFKGYSNDYNNLSLSNSYCTFMDSLKEGDLAVPRVYRNQSGSFAKGLSFNDKYYVFWVEERIEGITLDREEAFQVDGSFFRKIGQLLGDQHRLSRDKNLLLTCDTDFRLSPEGADENQENFKALLEIASSYYKEEELEGLKKTYLGLRDLLSLHMNDLSYGGVQGDLSPNNIIMENQVPTCLIDYNQAGNDIYISDMIQWGTYLVYGLFNTDEEEQMKAWFEAYRRGYEDKYHMDEAEIKCFPLLYILIKYLRCDQIWRLEDRVSSGDREFIKRYMTRMTEAYKIGLDAMEAE